jgi:hypothetical protein
MIEISINDTIERMAEHFEQVGEQMPAAISRALNRAGDMATTAIGRTLAHETGIAVGAAREAMSQKRSTPGDLEYVITIEGDFLPLSEFSPHETKKGISARPWGERRVFPSTFFIPGASGHVFARAGRERFPIRELWGPSLAREVERGQTEQVARDTVAEAFPRRLLHEVQRLLGKTGGGDGGE